MTLADNITMKKFDDEHPFERWRHQSGYTGHFLEVFYCVEILRSIQWHLISTTGFKRIQWAGAKMYNVHKVMLVQRPLFSLLFWMKRGRLVQIKSLGRWVYGLSFWNRKYLYSTCFLAIHLVQNQSWFSEGSELMPTHSQWYLIWACIRERLSSTDPC